MTSSSKEPPVGRIINRMLLIDEGREVLQSYRGVHQNLSVRSNLLVLIEKLIDAVEADSSELSRLKRHMTKAVLALATAWWEGDA